MEALNPENCEKGEKIVEIKNKTILVLGSSGSGKSSFSFHLTQNPVFDAKNETQQARIKEVITNLIPNSIEFIPEVYIQDKFGARELLSGSEL